MSLQESTPPAFRSPPIGAPATSTTTADNLALVIGAIRKAERAALTALLAAPRSDRRDALRDLAVAMHTPVYPLRGRLLCLCTPSQRLDLTPDL